MPREPTPDDFGERKWSRRQVLTTGAVGTGVTVSAGCIGNLGDDDDTFVIGSNLPLSAGWETLGEPMERGAELAVEEINDSGGLNGVEVRRIQEDNAASPETAREHTTRLVQEENIDLMHGPVLAHTKNAVLPFLEQHELPLLYTIDYEGHYGEGYCDPWKIGVGEVPAQLVNPIIPWAMDEGNESFSVLHKAT